MMNFAREFAAMFALTYLGAGTIVSLFGRSDWRLRAGDIMLASAFWSFVWTVFVHNIRVAEIETTSVTHDESRT